ncbi:MAG TPA: amidohydrolase family protein, partial [Planctomycetota bacterium]|nr:amidohydrolase family protein [Planctomycetota bacterium]
MTRLLLCLGLLAPPDDGLTAVRTARVHTGTGETIEGGVIVLRGGKIVEIRRDGEIPAGATVVDASRQVVVPGLIDAHTALADEGRDGDATVAQDVRAVDGLDFFAPSRRTLAGGVTTVYVSPGSKRLLSGQGAVVKTAGKDPRARVLRETWGLQVTLGEPSKNPPTVFEPPMRATPDDPIRPARRQYPASRMGQFAELRRAAAGPGPLRDRRPTLVVSAHEADDLVKAVLLAEELGTGIVLVDAEEAPAVADFLAPRRIPVVLNPGFAPGHREPAPAGDPRGRLDGVAALVRAGLRVALHAPEDADLRELLFIAAATVRQGLTRDEALACVTRAPAEILGVADRVGTIAPGRDADLVFLSADLFGPRTAVERVMIDGAFVYERTAADVQTYRALPESGPRKDMLAVRGGRVLTATQGVIPDGLVLVENGKVVYVGRGRP